jgi:hypothetical protein
MTCYVVLQLPTFSATAEMAAVSRLGGGYHIHTDNEVGMEQDRKVADFSWPKYQEYFNGTAKIREEQPGAPRIAGESPPGGAGLSPSGQPVSWM